LTFPTTTPSSPIPALLHSGRVGDIIWACAIAKTQYEKSDLYIRLNEKSNDIGHPNGNIMITEDDYKSLLPLLQHQPYLRHIAIHNREHIDVNLSEFRRYIEWRISLQRCYKAVCGRIDFENQWIFTPPVEQTDNIVVNLTGRYPPSVNLAPLLTLDVKFVGLEYEYQRFLAICPTAIWLETKTFFDLAQVIKSAHAFIGNQSTASALAEAMKCPRRGQMASSISANVEYGLGGNGVDIIDDKGLKLWLKQL
jgi:hypothetical protein